MKIRGFRNLIDQYDDIEGYEKKEKRQTPEGMFGFYWYLFIDT
jgi:hypothetical protein